MPDPLTIGEVRGDGASLILRAGSSTVNVVAQDSTPLATFSAAENYFGGAPRMRVDTEIYIDVAKVRGGLLQLHMTGNELITDEKSEVHGLILATRTGVPDGTIESLFGALVERNHFNRNCLNGPNTATCFTDFFFAPSEH